MGIKESDPTTNTHYLANSFCKVRAFLKRNKNLVLLSLDHHDGLLIVWKIRQGKRLSVSSARIEAFVTHAFATHLEPHFVEEEELLFVRLPKDDALRTTAETQHAAIRAMIAAFNTTGDTAIEEFEAFGNLLEEHIRFEERQLFPHLEKQVQADELEQIGQQLEQLHAGRTCEPWQDEFWINK